MWVWVVASSFSVISGLDIVPSIKSVDFQLTKTFRNSTDFSLDDQNYEAFGIFGYFMIIVMLFARKVKFLFSKDILLTYSCLGALSVGFSYCQKVRNHFSYRYTVQTFVYDRKILIKNLYNLCIKLGQG